jgi:hypothetical protein
MSTKNRLNRAEQAVKVAKPGLDVARLKPSEIIERIRAILAKCPPSDYTEHILQRLKNWENILP